MTAVYEINYLFRWFIKKKTPIIHYSFFVILQKLEVYKYAYDYKKNVPTYYWFYYVVFFSVITFLVVKLLQTYHMTPLSGYRPDKKKKKMTKL